MSKAFCVSVSWTVCGQAIAEAETEEEATEKAEDIPLADIEETYLDASFQVDAAREVKLDRIVGRNRVFKDAEGVEYWITERGKNP